MCLLSLLRFKIKKSPSMFYIKEKIVNTVIKNHCTTMKTHWPMGTGLALTSFTYQEIVHR